MIRRRLTAESLQWLRNRRISFEGSLNHFRLAPGHIVAFDANAPIEPYASFFAGTEFCDMGSFSFSHSALPIDTTIGRYCSIASNATVPGPNHPRHLLSSSAFLHERDFIGYSLLSPATCSPMRSSAAIPGATVSHGRPIGSRSIGSTTIRPIGVWSYRHVNPTSQLRPDGEKLLGRKRKATPPAAAVMTNRLAE